MKKLLVVAVLIVYFRNGTSRGFGQAVNVPELVSEALTEYQRGRFDQAEILFQQALEAVRGKDSIASVIILSRLGDVYVLQERFGDAERACAEALAIIKQSPNNRIEMVITLRNLANVYSVEMHHKQAMRALNEASRKIRVNDPEAQVLTVEILNSQSIV